MGHIYYEFRVHLRYIEPEIWRSFILPADASFKDLHLAIQDAFGWQQAHLYEFMRQFKRSAQTIAGIPKEMRTFGGSAGTPDAAKVGLWSYFDALPSCLYLYDFGDSWEHHVQRVRTFEETKERKTFRELTGGAYAGPPEDCGGVWGYETIAEFVRTGEVSDGWTKEELGGWLEDWDPDRFDLKTAKRAFGAASRVSRIPREEVAAAEVDFKDRSHLHKKHQQVFELLTDHMVAGGLDDQTIEHAHSMFEDFLEATDPPPRKPAIYAAAIEYILRGFYDNFWDRAELSQQDLADVYGTSTMSISKAYREIEEALDLEHNDPRYFTSSEKSVDDFMREFFFDAAPMPEFPAELGIIPAPILSTLSMLPRSSEAWEIARSALPSSYQGDGSHACVLHDTEDNGLYIIKEGVAIPPEIVAIVDAAMRLEHLPSHLTVSPAADDETLRTFLDFLGIGLASIARGSPPTPNAIWQTRRPLPRMTRPTAALHRERSSAQRLRPSRNIAMMGTIGRSSCSPQDSARRISRLSMSRRWSKPLAGEPGCCLSPTAWSYCARPRRRFGISFLAGRLALSRARPRSLARS